MVGRATTVVLFFYPLLALSAAGQSSGRFHLVRSVSGGRGAPDGNRFLIEDPRVIFHAGQDRQVQRQCSSDSGSRRSRSSSPGRSGSECHFELFDEEGRLRGSSKPRKLRLRQGESFVQGWEIDLAALKAGVYRVDVVAGTAPLWRSFFRMID
jgi:hypothetical protein